MNILISKIEIFLQKEAGESEEGNPKVSLRHKGEDGSREEGVSAHLPKDLQRPKVCNHLTSASQVLISGSGVGSAPI